MANSLPQASASPPRPLAAPSGTIFVVFLASAVACTLAYLALVASGPWLRSAPTLQWTPREFSVTRGTAQRTREGLVIAAPDAARTVVVSLNTSFRSRDYAVVAWDATGIPDDVEVTMLWYNDYAPSRMFRRALSVEAGRIVPTPVAQDRGWIGHIGGLALVLQGSFTEPIVLHGAAAKPMSAGQVLRDRLREWLAFEPWSGASINSLTGGTDTQDLPLPVFLAAIVAVAVAACGALAWRRPQRFGPMLWSGIAGAFLIAWVLIDARWQWNLARQVGSTQAQYAGKSWRERHLAADDAALFAFIEKVRERLPEPPARVFMFADASYFRARGAYHLYPYNVYLDPWTDSFPPRAAVRPGDYVVVYQRRGVQYDSAQQRLRWEGADPLMADLILVDTGAALFRIR